VRHTSRPQRHTIGARQRSKHDSVTRSVTRVAPSVTRVDAIHPSLATASRAPSRPRCGLARQAAAAEAEELEEEAEAAAAEEEKEAEEEHEAE
jgi:hypothetical protein